MRVSYLLPGFGTTGGSVVLYNFMDYLVAHGHEVYAVTPSGRVRWEPRSAASMIEWAGKRWSARRLASRAVSRVPRLKRFLKRVMAGRAGSSSVEPIYRTTTGLLNNWVEADATIATHFTTAFAAYYLMDRTVSFYHMQHYEELFCQTLPDRLLARMTYYLPLNLIANSTWLREQVRRRFGREAELVTPGIDRNIFNPHYSLDEKYDEMRPLRVVSYCDARHFKGWNDSVEAMRLVAGHLGSDSLAWTVFGSHNPGEIGVPYNHVGRIFNRDLAELYSKAHVVLAPSWYESYPLPPIEAMSCGTAVVTTKWGTEDYAVDGRNALVVPSRDPSQMAEAILKLARDTNLAKSLASQGIETAKEHSWERAGARLVEVLINGVRHQANPFSDVESLVTGGFHAERHVTHI